MEHVSKDFSLKVHIFTEKYKGAQNPSYMRNPSIAELDQWLESSKRLLKKVALAPERDEVTEFINYVKKIFLLR